MLFFIPAPGQIVGITTISRASRFQINSLLCAETVSHLQLPLRYTLSLRHTLLLFLIRMRFEGLPSLALFGLATSHAIQVRSPAEAAAVAVAGTTGSSGNDKGKDWHPQTKQPHFFNLRVNDRCDAFASPTPETLKSQCPFDSYAIRLEQGILVATPYNKWWDPKLPTFFVDDDTQLYTVSPNPSEHDLDSHLTLYHNRSARIPSNSTLIPLPVL